MTRRRTTPLPRGITERRRKSGIVYLLSFVDQHGVLRQELAGRDLREAQRLLAQRRAEVAARTYAWGAASTEQTTLGAFAESWMAERRSRGVRSVDDEATRYRLHIAPTLGKVRLGDIRPANVAALVESLRRSGALASKTILNVHGVLHAMLEAARFREIIVANPASLPRGMLPRASRKRGPRFERAELWALLTDPRIEEHRRIFYALMALGGMRCGEASGRRWRDLDNDTPHLAALRVHSQYDDRPLKTSRDDDTAERMVPVHPELARLLASWRLSVFPRLYGRPARPEDWICADPRTMLPRTQGQAGNALLRDCARIGIAKRGTHAFRRAFISLARSDGARADVLERVTHNARGDMIDVYTDLEWSALCEAVSCLRFETRRAEVIALPRVASAQSGDDRDSGRPQLDATPAASTDEPGFPAGNAWRWRESNAPPSTDSTDRPGTLATRPAQRGPQNPRDSVNAAKRLTRVNLGDLECAEATLRRAGHGAEADAVRAAIEALRGAS